VRHVASQPRLEYGPHVFKKDRCRRQRHVMLLAEASVRK
jgi:hypothetical protein